MKTNPGVRAPRRFIRMPEITEQTGLSRSTIYDLIAAGEFPRQVRLSKRSVGWPEEAVAPWKASREHAAQKTETGRIGVPPVSKINSDLRNLQLGFVRGQAAHWLVSLLLLLAGQHFRVI
jgi:prophage regulatory protein